MTTYTSRLKEDLIRRFPGDLYELAGFLHTIASVHLRGRGILDVSFETEKNVIARHYYKYLKTDFGLDVEIRLEEVAAKKRYRVLSKNSSRLLKEVGIVKEQNGVLELESAIPAQVLQSEGAKRSFFRGAFLAGGTIADPNKKYELMLSFRSKELSEAMLDLLIEYGSFGLTESRGRFIVYSKSAEVISDFLTLIGATKEALELENIRVVKSVKNDINRQVNFETANIEKTVKAASDITRAIEKIQSVRGIHTLPPSLQEISILRLEEPELSLKELGEKCNPPISKSGVKNRLVRIQKLAEKL
ncbi:DNA-binding protein WhiA [Guggenheimella bovis]